MFPWDPCCCDGVMGLWETEGFRFIKGLSPNPFQHQLVTKAPLLEQLDLLERKEIVYAILRGSQSLFHVVSPLSRQAGFGLEGRCGPCVSRETFLFSGCRSHLWTRSAFIWNLQSLKEPLGWLYPEKRKKNVPRWLARHENGWQLLTCRFSC